MFYYFLHKKKNLVSYHVKIWNFTLFLVILDDKNDVELHWKFRRLILSMVGLSLGKGIYNKGNCFFCRLVCRIYDEIKVCCILIIYII